MKYDKKEILKFGLLMGGIALVTGGYLYWKQNPKYLIALVTGAGILFAGFITPRILFPFYWIWMKFALILGKIMNKVVIVLFYYLVVTPTGLLARLFGQKFLDTNWNKDKATYWQKRKSVPFQKQDYERQF